MIAICTSMVLMQIFTPLFCIFLNGKKLNVEKDTYILTKYFWDNFVMIFNVFEYSDSLEDVSSGKIINELH